MNLDQLVTKMKAVPLKELAEISKQAGVPYGTALKIRGGFTKNPGVRTVAALLPYFVADEVIPQPNCQGAT